MKQRKLSISLYDLPSRTENIPVRNLINIFGGCKDEGEECKKNSDCCGDMGCSAGYIWETDNYCTDKGVPFG